MDPTDEREHVSPGRPGELDGARVTVSSRLGLVAETICAALRGRGLAAVYVSWGPDDQATVPAPRTEGGERPAIALLACDLAQRAVVDDVCERGRSSGVPWVVLTDGGRGAPWGAVLAAGARAVVPSTISLDGLVETLWTVLHGESPMGKVERLALIQEWRTAEEFRDGLRRRMDSLSPREGEVLSMLYEGTTVREIARRLGVSEATVRSQVKAVLRKLSVASQLAAVAAVGEVRQADEDGPG